MPLSVDEFSAKIKSKYPEYKDVDNKVLAEKIVAKYPEYKDKVSFETPEQQTSLIPNQSIVKPVLGAIKSQISPFMPQQAVESPIGQFLISGILSEDTANDWSERIGRQYPESGIRQAGAAALGTVGQMISPADLLLGATGIGLKLSKSYKGMMEGLENVGEGLAPRTMDLSKMPAEKEALLGLKEKFKPIEAKSNVREVLKQKTLGEPTTKLPTKGEWLGEEKAQALGYPKPYKPVTYIPKPIKTIDDHIDNIIHEEAPKVIDELGVNNDVKAISNLEKARVRADKTAVEHIPEPPILALQNLRPKAYESFMNDMVRSISVGLKKQGVYGTWIANRLKSVRDISDLKTADTTFEVIPMLKKLSNKETTQLVNALDKGEEITSPKVQQSYDFIKRKFNDIANEAKQVGLTTKRKIITDTGETIEETNPWQPKENFYPHIHDFAKLLSDGTEQEKTIAYLIKTKQAKNRLEAADALNQYFKRNMTRRVGNLEYSRTLDLPDFDRNPTTALSHYFKNAYHRIEEAKAFGPNDEKTKFAIQKIFEQGGNAEYVREAFDRAVKIKRDEITPKAWMGAARNIATWTKMGLSAITNATQPMQAYSITSEISFAKGMKDILTKEGRDFAIRAGVVLDSTLESLIRQGAGASVSGGKYLRAVGFTQVEKFNRTLSANVGREYFLDLFKNAKKYPADKTYQRELLKLGFSPKQLLNKVKPSLQDEYMAARSVVERTQFLIDPQDLPFFWSSPWGKFSMQLKTFAYKQTQFIKNEILNEATKGNLKPLARFLTAGAAAGELVQDVKSVIKNKERDKKGFDRLVENLSSMGGLGIASDIVYNINGTTPKLGMMVAPASFSSIGEIGAGVLDLISGEGKKAAKHISPNIPFIGPTLSGLLKEKPGNIQTKRREYRK